jgi:hypothetical protein
VHEWYDPESAFPITIDETLRVVAVPRNLDQLQAKLRSTHGARIFGWAEAEDL